MSDAATTASYTILERTAQLLKIEQRLPQAEVIKRAVRGSMIIAFAILMPLVVVMFVAISGGNSFSQDLFLTWISWIVLLLPFVLVGFVGIVYFRTRSWMGFTVAEIDKGMRTCRVQSGTLDRTERQRGIKMARTYPLGNTDEFRVMSTSELSGVAAFILKLMMKGMYHLVLYSGPLVLPNFIFIDLTLESLQGIKDTIDEFLAQQ